jgi:hypothetical protein
LVTKALRYLAGSLRCGFVSMSDLFFTAVVPCVECHCTS